MEKRSLVMREPRKPLTTLRNESGNGLLLHYWSKYTDFNQVAQRAVMSVITSIYSRMK
jgi:IS30 family transposase